MSETGGPVEPRTVVAADDAPQPDLAPTSEARREQRRYRLEKIGVAIAALGLVAAGLQVWYAARAAATPPAVPSPAAPLSLEEAIALATNDRTAEAMEAFSRLSAAEPRNPLVHANACGFYLQANHLALARQACLTAVSNGPSSWLAQYNNACVLALEGRTNEALNALSLALATVGTDTAAKLTRAKLAERAVADGMLQSLRADARFKKLTATP